MTSNATLPHAVALAQELEIELRHLDALQQHYAQLLVHQLSSLDFLNEGDAATMVSAKEPTMAHNGGCAVAKPEVAVATTCIKQPSAVPLPWRRHTHDAARVLQPPFRHSACPVPSTISSSSSPLLQPLAATSVPPPLSPQPKRSGRSAVKPVTPRPNADKTCKDLPRHQPHVAAAPVVPASTKDEATRRARRALRFIREERDAYFNAKARRAEELLREGREAARKNRARRQADMAQTLPKAA
ncbi:hypothetical protein conserved [Leishmania donovani]|uniref:Uncharacterized protein n=3 Tax=Leishmania donovani species complex TaxID=38574 RepID=A4HSG9_LEIIN|nr:hypothetical protein, unknown function [Leishmania infantum JPCM5]TPP51854.1 hypothetical protein CGC20_24375 [Leishmania donovani]CAC9443307.1 hypothetical_protein_-_conserved [Leishmania infantum]CAJ1986018.1 hypothetical protein conserved [Leishmania donovani]CAM65356.1 hypothetical protein, unknown function [Leishmania infantum JPCM5]SUZ38967.1 hypothetical_protein_-_conserved [Leishmania infantum]|eukprot:XP_001463010.1 hypothetical protein, unknown function [Leishmania infantum JPCM5]